MASSSNATPVDKEVRRTPVGSPAAGDEARAAYAGRARIKDVETKLGGF
jgi:hypothetical protein